MKAGCEVCERAEAQVLCCADEAVLCGGCDKKVHAAKKLSQKHPRVSLLKHPPAASSLSSSQLPLCDICQERNGYFFCLEDRAILCRHCDMSAHMTSPFVSSHQRFLIEGIKVALESSTNNTTHETSLNQRNYQRLTFSNSYSLSDFPRGEESSAAMTQDIGANSSEAADHLASAASASASWPLDDILGTNEFNDYEFSDMESSRITDP